MTRGLPVGVFALTAAVLAVALTPVASAFYVPGIAPVGYDEGEDVLPLANGLHSLASVLPQPFYSGPFCRPTVVESARENLGAIIMGDRLETSPFLFQMAVNQRCLKACRGGDAGTSMTPERLKRLELLIEQRYRAFLALDNLPVFNNGSAIYGGRCRGLNKNDLYQFQRGFALGVSKDCTGGKTAVNNHVHFRIQYHRTPESEHRVVGFAAVPYSVTHKFDGAGVIQSCGETFDLVQMSQVAVTTDPAETTRIGWTYGVEWVEEPGITWASRWDSYLHTSYADSNNRIHWVGILNGVAIVFGICSFATVGLWRSLRSDLSVYAAALVAGEEEGAAVAKEESGWKPLAKEIMRPPPYAHYLFVCVGVGVQLLGMATLTIVFACFGLLSPANRGGLVTAMILGYVAQTFVAGYIVARLAKSVTEKRWSLIFATALSPAVAFYSCYAVITVVSVSQHAIRLPLMSLILLTATWGGASLPLGLLGAAYGYQGEPLRPKALWPVGPMPREVPEGPSHLADWCVILTGLVPLAGVMGELRFVLASMWQGMVYYVFGFLALVFFLWTICCCVTAVGFVYYRLVAENHRWWWVAFLAPSGAGVPLAIYATYFGMTQLSLASGGAVMVFLSFMTMAVGAYVLMAGAIGVLISALFISRIFDAVKMD